ncbi:MAG: preprotein translocase subunit SecG [Proteobacteria bacterium]|nr:preprotein translocase subunit SecG [Pseudomonadota bacterium]
MQTTFLIIHTLIALAIIGLVLIQRGKGADAGAAFGSGASGTVFGARGSTSFFSRATAVLATAFFATSLTLAYLSSQRTGAPASLLESIPATEIEQQAPVAPITNDGVPALDVDDAESLVEDADVPAIESDALENEPTPEE